MNLSIKSHGFARLLVTALAALLLVTACSGQTIPTQTQKSSVSESASANNPQSSQPQAMQTSVSIAPTATTAPASAPTFTKVAIIDPTATTVATPVQTEASTQSPANTESAGDPITDTCSYLTSEQVQPVVDSRIIEVLSNTNTFNVKVLPAGNCTFRTSYGGLALVIAKPDDAQGSSAWAQDQIKFFTNMSPDSTTVQIKGLGEEAVWMDNGKSAGGFGVAQYPYLFAVLIGGKLPNSPQAYQPELRVLAKTLLSELH